MLKKLKKMPVITFFVFLQLQLLLLFVFFLLNRNEFFYYTEREGNNKKILAAEVVEGEMNEMSSERIAVSSICPLKPPNLVGTLPAPNQTIPNGSDAERIGGPELMAGGRWRPTNCRSRQRVAILIAYRQRWKHLMMLMNNLHNHLQRQQLDYQIFVLDQHLPPGGDRYNKARMFNVGYLEIVNHTAAQGAEPWDCLVLHDVDSFPQDDRNLYRCDPTNPRLLMHGRDRDDFKPLWMGGVVALTPQQFEAVNGYSNYYWGYGGEDDDFGNRVLKAGYEFVRSASNVGKYVSFDTTIKVNDGTNPRVSTKCMDTLDPYHQISATGRQKWDGLSQLRAIGDQRQQQDEQQQQKTIVEATTIVYDQNLTANANANATGTGNANVSGAAVLLSPTMPEYRLLGWVEHRLYTNISVDLLMAQNLRLDGSDPCKGIRQLK